MIALAIGAGWVAIQPGGSGDAGDRGRSGQILWVGEEFDRHESGRYAARFSVYSERQGSPVGPEFVEFDVALAWAREHASFVAVRIGDTVLSAGERALVDVPLLSEPWPRIRSRPVGTPWNGSQQTRPWAITAIVVTRASSVELSALSRALAGDGVQEVAHERTDANEAVIRLTVVAAGLDSATLLATDRIAERIAKLGIDAYVRSAGTL